MHDIWNGIIVGGAGGAIAGLVLSLVSGIHSLALTQIHKRRVYGWLLRNSSSEAGNQYRSTRTIASWNNLTEDRVRYICSIHKKIYLSTGQKEDLWSLYEHGDRSTYETRGIQSV